MIGIGRQALCDFANQMNDRRSEHGVRERYKVVLSGNKLTLDTYHLPSTVDPYSRSSPYTVPR